MAYACNYAHRRTSSHYQSSLGTSYQKRRQILSVNVAHKDKKERLANLLAGRQVAWEGGIAFSLKRRHFWREKKLINSTATKWYISLLYYIPYEICPCKMGWHYFHVQTNPRMTALKQHLWRHTETALHRNHGNLVTMDIQYLWQLRCDSVSHSFTPRFA
jgi:hypothetical protein